MYDPTAPGDLHKLREARRFSTKQLRPFRRNYTELIEQYAGDRYGDQQEELVLPVNMIRLAIDVWSRMLAAATPRVLVSTREPALKPDAYELSLGIDHLLEQIKFAVTQRLIVKSALFQMGICKIGLTSGSLPGTSHAVGRPFADNVLFTDWVHDMNARSVEEWEFCGNRYTLPLKDVRDNPFYENTDQLQGSRSETAFDSYGDGDERPEDLSQGEGFEREEYVEHVTLWDIYLPREKLLVTLTDDDGPPLAVVPWQGPERGPYHALCFGEVPGNMIPAGMAGTLFDIHELLNSLFVKVARQAEDQKRVGVASSAMGEDTQQRLIDAEDGDIINSIHGAAMGQLNLGGVDQQTLGLVSWLRNLGSYMGGNLDSLAGLQSGADTLGQEKLLMESSSQLIEDMQSKVESFVQDVVSDLGWWLYTDPNMVLPLTKPVGDDQIQSSWGPDERHADWFEYVLKIVPYSTRPQSPHQKLAFLDNLMQRLVLPMAETGMLDRAGMHVDIAEYLRLVSNLADMPEVNDIIRVSGGGSLPSAPIGSGGSRMPSSTSREYVRRDRGNSDNNLDMTPAAMGGASMPSGANPSLTGAG